MFPSWITVYDYVTEHARSLVAEAKRESAAQAVRARMRAERRTAALGRSRAAAAARGDCRDCPAPAEGGATAA